MISQTNAIKILVEYTTKGLEKVKNANNAVRDMNKQVYASTMEQTRMTSVQKKAREQMGQYNQQAMGFGKVMKMNQGEFKNFNQSGYKFSTIGGRMANRMRMATVGLRGFRMEMLGVMFFGMAMSRMFTGLLKQSLEWTGVNKVLSTTLGILFLPIALKILDWALWFLDVVSNLSEGTKLFIGKIVLIGAAIGGVLFVFGTLFLGIGSLILAFGWLLSPIGAVIAIIAGLAIAKFLAGDFDTLSDGIDGARGKLVAFGVSGEAFDKVVDFAKNSFNKIIDFLRGLIGRIGEFLPDFIKAGGELLLAIGSGIVDNIDNIISAAGKVLQSIINYISNNLGKIIDGGLKILNAIIDGIMNNLDKIEEIVEELVRALTDFVVTHADEFVTIGAKIGVAIAKGIGKSLGGWFNKFDDWIEDVTGIQTRIKGDYTSGNIYGYAKGGVVPGPLGKPTLAMVHGGETITPPGGAGFSPNITINASIASDYDVRKLAEELKRYWVQDFERVSQGRGI